MERAEKPYTPRQLMVWCRTLRRTVDVVLEAEEQMQAEEKHVHFFLPPFRSTKAVSSKSPKRARIGILRVRDAL